MFELVVVVCIDCAHVFERRNKGLERALNFGSSNRDRMNFCGRVRDRSDVSVSELRIGRTRFSDGWRLSQPLK